jgi:thioredoxin reductase (NADPH)
LNSSPNVSEMLVEAFQMRRSLLASRSVVGVRVVGTTNTPKTSRLREFFYKNHVPHTFFEALQSDGQEQLQKLGSLDLALPVVRCNGVTFRDPSLFELAECIGISHNVDQQLFDLVIVGSGPAGLAAAVYASSEGIKTLVIDSVGPGGQAASSSKIENFIGFPTGLSGSDLANRGYLQALKFGTQFIAPIIVDSIETVSGEHHLKLSSGQTARARCVLVASGVSYRQLDLPGCQRLEGAGVYYAATSVEARVCDDSIAVVVGGGNSAGQAAMFLATKAREVKMVIRGPDLSKGMSSYLSDRVMKHPKITVVPHSEVTCIRGESRVESIETRNAITSVIDTIHCPALFIFIGAQPHTAWLPESVLLDDKGFVLTGSAFYTDPSLRSLWRLDRTPCDLETTIPGILAAGDVRSGTTKRCGFAVGDGSLAVSCVHRILAQH